MRQFKFNGYSSTYLWKETPVNGKSYSVQDIIRMRSTVGLDVVCDGSVEGIQAYIDKDWQDWTLMAEVPEVQEIYERGKWYDVKNFIPSGNYHSELIYVSLLSGDSMRAYWDNKVEGFVDVLDVLLDDVESWYLYFD